MPSPTESETLQAFLENPANHIVARLAKSPMPFDAEELVLADFIEADFLGYEPIDDFDWTFKATGEDDYALATSKPLLWTAGVFIEPQKITAVYLTIQVGADPMLLFWPFPFEVPLIMGIAGTVFSKQILIPSFNPPA